MTNQSASFIEATAVAKHTFDSTTHGLATYGKTALQREIISKVVERVIDGTAQYAQAVVLGNLGTACETQEEKDTLSKLRKRCGL